MAYMIRIRNDDKSEWGPPEAFQSKRARDKAGAMARIIGGLRTHSWHETKAEERARLVEENAVDPDDGA